MTAVAKTTVRTRQGNSPPPESTHTISGRKPGEVKNLKGVLFGPPKTGKTTLACSGKNVLLVSFDPDGDATETLVGRDDVTVVTPTSAMEVDQLIRALHSTDKDRFDWVVFDSLTFYFQMVGGAEITDVYKNNKDVRRAYGRAGAVVAQSIHDLCRLDTNVIFTAHIQKEVDDDGVSSVEHDLGETEVKVAVTPMVWRILGPAVSFIGRTYKTLDYETVREGNKTKRNKVTVYGVSFNDGDRSPAGSRLKMNATYTAETNLLDVLAQKLTGGKK